MAEKLDPNAIADDGNENPEAQAVDATMIYDYVLDTELPPESAEAFAQYADNTWYEYNDGSKTQTNSEIIAGMLAYWRGQ